MWTVTTMTRNCVHSCSTVRVFCFGDCYKWLRCVIAGNDGVFAIIIANISSIGITGITSALSSRVTDLRRHRFTSVYELPALEFLAVLWVLLCFDHKFVIKNVSPLSMTPDYLVTATQPSWILLPGSRTRQEVSTCLFFKSSGAARSRADRLLPCRSSLSLH